MKKAAPLLPPGGNEGGDRDDSELNEADPKSKASRHTRGFIAMDKVASPKVTPGGT